MSILGAGKRHAGTSGDHQRPVPGPRCTPVLSSCPAHSLQRLSDKGDTSPAERLDFHPNKTSRALQTRGPQKPHVPPCAAVHRRSPQYDGKLSCSVVLRVGRPYHDLPVGELSQQKGMTQMVSNASSEGALSNFYLFVCMLSGSDALRCDTPQKHVKPRDD